MATTSRKTMQLDLLQVNALNFKTTSNTNIPSSFILYAVGDGTTAFTSVSSLVTLGYTSVSVPGQVTIKATDSSEILTISSITSDIYISTNTGICWFGIPNLTSTINSTILSTISYMLPSTFNGTSNVIQSNINSANAITNSNITSVIASTMYNILSYPNICSTIGYVGNNGLTPLQGLTNTAVSGTAYFSSLQYNFSNFTQYINPNGSSRVFIDYSPNFLFSQVSAPSSISSIALYPEGNSYIKDTLSISSYVTYLNSGNLVPIDKSALQQYIPVTSFQPFGFSTNTRVLSNSFIQRMTMEIDSKELLNSNSAVSLMHYISDAVVYKTVDPTDVSRTGLENSNVLINIDADNDKNIVFVRIVNSGNQY